MYKRTLTNGQKNYIAGRQFYKCANKPGITLTGLENYNCHLWSNYKNPGSFDISGYEIDHITEFSISQDNRIKNLQALCPNCHSVKTRKFNRKSFIDENISFSEVVPMDLSDD